SGGTIVDAVGGYSKERKQILYFVVNRFQIARLKKVVSETDPEAFVSLQDVSGIVKSDSNQ
ncbi:MAG: YitT family protein, partial [Bacilli bacterium]|nr:YitT family protein [Bacilli bacterium]